MFRQISIIQCILPKLSPNSIKFKKYKLSSVEQCVKKLSNIRCMSSCNVSLKLDGIYPPIITTFSSNGDVVHDKLLYNLEKWKDIPFRGYVVLGSTGEFVTLAEEEKLKLVKCIRENIPKEKLIVVGTGCESTSGTIELTNKTAALGADAALVVSPFFYKGRMTEDTLYDHYVKVADSCKIPIILYSVPANTGIDLTSSLVAKLSQHSNVIGLKDSGGDITKIAHIVSKTKTNNFQVLAGSAGFLYPALSVGCVGGVVALANPLGSRCCQLYQYFLEGEHAEAAELQHRLIGPNLCVTRRFGIPGVKAAMDLLGYKGGLCRPPLKSLSAEELVQLKKEFKTNGFL